jgi:hypothetical protein
MTRSASSEPPADTHVDRRLAIFLSVVLCLVAAGIGWLMWSTTARSSANFADTEQLADNRLGAATLDIDVGTTGTPLSAGNLVPGDSASGQVDITNSGTLPLVLTARVNTGFNPLSRAVRFTAWTVASACAVDDLENGRADRVLDAVAGGATIDLTGSTPLRLAPDEAVILCLRAELPISAGNEAQGQTVFAELVLDAVHDLESEVAADDQSAEVGP